MSDVQHGAVVPPLHLSTNFAFAGLDRPREYDYTRTANPTRDQLAEALAEAEGGASAVVTSSGMSAIHLVLQLLRPGDLIVAAHDLYGGAHRLFHALQRRGDLRVEFVDFHDDQARRDALARAPHLVWVETPSNPLLRLIDLQALRAEADERTLIAVDNTFLSPALQQPIRRGADFVVHSTTKYVNGHSDVVGGAVIASDAAHGEELSWWANCLGTSGAPFDAFLTLRGLRTLKARMRIHEENAQALAELLNDHPAVARTWYPGLASHPDHDLACAQQDGFGGMLSFELRAPRERKRETVEAFLSDLRCFSLAVSLGGVESLIAHPATMTHAAVPVDARRRAGVGDALLRISAGIEATEDLLADVRRGLDRADAVAEIVPLQNVESYRAVS